MADTSVQTIAPRAFLSRWTNRAGIAWRWCIYGTLAYFAASFAFAFAALQDPQESTGAVFHPEFTLTDDSIWAGKMFIAEVEHCTTPLAISASHLFGPSGGYARQLSPQEIGSLTSNIDLYNLVGPTVSSFAAKSLTPHQGAGDMVAFVAPDTLGDVALPLAQTLPRNNSKVWVVTSVYTDNEALVHEARVLGVDDGHFYYDFVDPDYDLMATSGAPVINSRGEVIAINLGGGKNNDGSPWGFGNPVTAWKPLLEQECTRSNGE